MRATRVLTAICLTGLLSCSPRITTLREPSPAQDGAADPQEQQMIQAMEQVRAADLAAEQRCGPVRAASPDWAEERAVGRALAVRQTASRGRVDTGETAAWVALVGHTLVTASPRPGLPWVFAVIHEDEPAAFSDPGGYVFVTTGLLKRLTNEAQLAGVLGHEIGHVSAKHGLRAWHETKGTACTVSVTAELLLRVNAVRLPPSMRDAAHFGPKFPADGLFEFDHADPGLQRMLLEQLALRLSLGFERADELAADAEGLRLLAFAGYDPAEYERFLTAQGDVKGHPKTEERVARLTALREGELAPFIHGTAKPDVSAHLEKLRTP
jgi:predicted Zn-dependent protease